MTGVLAAAAAAAPSLTLSAGALAEPEGTSTLVKIAVVMTVLTLLPSVLILFTAFIRFVIVFHFLRQAIGTQTIPPNQVLIGLALMLTFFVMEPVGTRVWNDAVLPYQQGTISTAQAVDAGVVPVKDWMLRNTRESDLLLFAGLAKIPRPATRLEIPMRVVMPAFLISELKTGFQIGFLLFLPFLVVDLVVSSVLLSMGMMMLPPVVVSFPFKVLLFVMVDGWALLVGSLVQSFR
jgi:flagellar biosynthetic protein FliP